MGLDIVRLANLGERSGDDLASLRHMLDALVAKNRLKTLAGGIAEPDARLRAPRLDQPPATPPRSASYMITAPTDSNVEEFT